jgi:Spy/CpxP family protein refolding chaperone
MNITGSIRALLAVALLCVAVPTQQAAAQFWFGGGPARNPVLASKDLEEILDSAGLDDGQRQLAASMFDDAQLPMFAAKRRFDDEMARIGTANRDEKTTAAQQQARRALAQSIMESMDSFFQSLAAVARPEQQNDLQREHLAAKRRALRAMFGGALSDGAIQWDVERCIADAKLPPEARSAAYRALGDYRQRLDAIFPKLLEAVPDASRANGPWRWSLVTMASRDFK